MVTTLCVLQNGRVLTAKDVIEAVVIESGIGFPAFRGSTRDRRYARPRQLAAFLIRTLGPNVSYARIGKAMGKDARTVQHGFDLMGHLLSRDTDLKGLHDRVCRRLGVAL